MSDAATDPYEVVIADLRAQRDKIDQTLSLLESLRGRASGGADVTSPQQPSAHAQGMGPGAFLGVSIVDGAKKLLTHERRQLSNGEIFDAFKRGGLHLNSADPQNTIGSVLNRRFQQVGDVVRVGRGTWGLKEWYPNRSFRSAKGATEAAENVSDAGEQMAAAVAAHRQNEAASEGATMDLGYLGKGRIVT